MFSKDCRQNSKGKINKIKKQNPCFDQHWTVLRKIKEPSVSSI
jgi:hypothetical protein